MRLIIGVKNPTEELTIHIPLTLVVGYFADAQYDGLFLSVFAREAKRRSKLPGGWRSTEYKFRTFSVGYFADAQYDVLFYLSLRQ